MSDTPTPESPILTFPIAWEIQRTVKLDHHPQCSCVPREEEPMAGPHFLCDCGAVTKEWERRNNQMEP